MYPRRTGPARIEIEMPARDGDLIGDGVIEVGPGDPGYAEADKYLRDRAEYEDGR